MDNTVYFWLSLGIILLLAEVLVPGLVVIFLGMAALIVAGAIALGLLQGWMSILTVWFITSLVLIFTLRNLFARFNPGNTEVGNLDEDLDAFGTLVEVVKDVHPYNEDGRIACRGTTWAARCPATSLSMGSQARLLRREGSVWIIEPIETRPL